MGIFFLLLLLLLCVAWCEASIWRVRGQHARGAKEAKSKKEAPFLKRKKSRDLRENESERASERDPHTHGATRAFLYLLYAFIGPRGSLRCSCFFFGAGLLPLLLWVLALENSPRSSTPRPAQIPARNEERGVRSATRTRRRATKKKIAKCKRTYKSNIFKRQREREREREREKERERQAGYRRFIEARRCVRVSCTSLTLTPLSARFPIW